MFKQVAKMATKTATKPQFQNSHYVLKSITTDAAD